MARQFLTAIDLAKNELQNPAIHNLAAAPSSPVKGQLYMDTTTNILYFWDGTAWQSTKAGAAFPGYGAVPAETTFGIAKNDGVATTVARSDHTHGSPTHDSAAHSAIPISALAAATANVSMGGFKLTNLAEPVQTNDAATRLYVDNMVAGLSWKAPVQVATTTNGTFATSFAAGQTIDGVVLQIGNRLLIKNQTNQTENGIYTVTPGAPIRTQDADSTSELRAAAVFVESGTTNADTAWTLTTDAPDPGTSNLVWVQFAGGGTVTAGTGMTQSGNTLNVVAADSSLVVAADSITRGALTGDVTAAQGSNATTIANDAVTNAKLANMAANTIKGNNTGAAADPLDLTATQVTAMLNTFTTTLKGLVPAPTTATGKYLKDDGTWATVVTSDTLGPDGDKGDVTVGGTGTTLTIDNGVVTNAKLANMPFSPAIKGRVTAGAGVAEDITMLQFQGMVANYLGRIYSQVVGGSTAQVITHNLNTFAVMVQVSRNSAPFETLECDVERTTANTVTLRFAVAPAASSLAVVVIG